MARPVIASSRRVVVGVMGGSKASGRVRDLAYDLGRLIAERGWVLLNGGRAAGVMDASAAGARSAGGLVIGILPDGARGRTSRHVDIAILTGAGDARNLYNVLSSDVVVACPGKLGTMSEVVLALKYRRPVVAVAWVPVLDLSPRYRRLLHCVDTPVAAVATVAELLGNRTC